MRLKTIHSVLALVAILPVGILASGCSAEFCDLVECNTGGGGTGGNGTGASGTGAGTTSNGGGGSGGSSTTGLPDECDPNQLMAGQPIADICGVFVEPAATGGDGTKGSPLGTIAEALAKPGVQRIYVCADGAQLNEAVSLPSTIALVGSLKCADWSKAAVKTAWTAGSNEVPLIVESGAAGSIVQGFAITAAAASGFDAATKQGRSSIAMIVDGAATTIEDVDLVAGTGAAGGPGVNQTGQAPGRQSDAAMFNGHDGKNCGLGAGGSTLATCPGGAQSIGGNGGAGDLAGGNSGIKGSPDPMTMEPNGSPGVGDDGSTGTCTDGEKGSNGPAGQPLAGGTIDATISVSAPFYVGEPGTDGSNGVVGQGGGGGGGLRGNGANGCGANVTGPSGGSGGAGGCGGLAGGGGGAGGASIALVVLDAAVTVTNVTVSASSGGSGGAGGNGQLAGTGGLAGASDGNACGGGAGGNGGNGGPGAGGAGGASIGLAYTGANAPAIDPGNITVAAVAAMPGNGGTGGMMGAAGDLQQVRSF